MKLIMWVRTEILSSTVHEAQQHGTDAVGQEWHYTLFRQGDSGFVIPCLHS